MLVVSAVVWLLAGSVLLGSPAVICTAVGFPAGAAGGYVVRWLGLLPCWLWLLFGCCGGGCLLLGWLWCCFLLGAAGVCACCAAPAAACRAVVLSGSAVGLGCFL